MAISLSDDAVNDAADAVVDGVDAASPTAGKIEIRTGAKPANVETVASGTLLATVTLADPAFGASGAVNPGEAVLAGTPLEDSNPVASGTAGWFRCYDGASVGRFDGTVGTSNADMIVNTTTVTAGVPFRITAGTYTHPKSE